MRKITGIAVTLATAVGIGLVTGLAQWAKAEDASAQAAYRDIENTLGSVPGFFKAFPESGIAGAWAQTLVLPYTSQAISSDALMTVARSCIFLQGIDLTGCDGVTDEVVEAIATKCDLCAINLSYCNNITPHAAQLLTVASDIEWINLLGAKHIAQHEDRNTVAATLGNARKKGKLQQLQYFLV